MTFFVTFSTNAWVTLLSITCQTCSLACDVGARRIEVTEDSAITRVVVGAVPSGHQQSVGACL